MALPPVVRIIPQTLALFTFETNAGRRRALFIHIPKTGGSTVRAHLKERFGVNKATCNRPTDPKHYLPSQVTSEYDFSFAFVRNPLRWYESFWRYLHSPSVIKRELIVNGKPDWDKWVGEGVWHPCREIAPCHSDDFGTFMENVIDLAPAFVTRMYNEYLGPPGEPIVDFIGKNESLQDDFQRMMVGLKVADAPMELPRRNRSRKIHVTWPKHLLRKVTDLEKPTLDFYYPGV